MREKERERETHKIPERCISRLEIKTDVGREPEQCDQIKIAKCL